MTDDMRREAFERWARANGGSIKICTDRGSYLRGSYEHIATHEQWVGWQAAIRHMREQEDKA